MASNSSNEQNDASIGIKVTNRRITFTGFFPDDFWKVFDETPEYAQFPELEPCGLVSQRAMFFEPESFVTVPLLAEIKDSATALCYITIIAKGRHAEIRGYLPAGYFDTFRAYAEQLSEDTCDELIVLDLCLEKPELGAEGVTLFSASGEEFNLEVEMIVEILGS